MDFMKEMLARIRETTPLVHFITNYVTVNDCANITLACGGSPLMADETEEVQQMVALASALTINIGTINAHTRPAMLLAGCHANALQTPVVLDPAGAGASEYRNSAVDILMREVDFDIIKGNISEVKFLSDGLMATNGVDAAQSDLVCEENLDQNILFARKLSVMTGSVIVITGPIDIIANATTAYVVRNGHPIMPQITGTGCMSAALLGCFVGANPEHPLEAAVASTCLMGVCGELAQERLVQSGGGTGTFRTLLIDSVSTIDEETLLSRARVEKR